MKTHVCRWCWCQDSGDKSKLRRVFSIALIWMKDGTPSSSGLPLPGVLLLGSLYLEGTNTSFADLGELQGLFLDFPQRVTESDSVVHTSINCFKRDPHLPKKPIKYANRHALFRDSCCSNDHVQRITEPQTLSTTSSWNSLWL